MSDSFVADSQTDSFIPDKKADSFISDSNLNLSTGAQSDILPGLTWSNPTLPDFLPNTSPGAPPIKQQLADVPTRSEATMQSPMLDQLLIGDAAALAGAPTSVPLIPGFAAAQGLKLADKAVAPAVLPLLEKVGALGAKMIGPEARLLIDDLATRALQGGQVGDYFARYGEAPLIEAGGKVAADAMPSVSAGAAGAAVEGADALLSGQQPKTFAQLKAEAVDKALNKVYGKVAKGDTGLMPKDAVRAVKLNSGEVVKVPEDFAGDHADLVNQLGIKLEDVQSTGWVRAGKYEEKELTLPGIRPEKFATPEEQALAEKVIQNIPDEALTKANRGVVTDQSAIEAARASGWNKDTVLRIPIGTALNKEDSYRVTGVFVSEINKQAKLQAAWEAAVKSGEKPEVVDALEGALIQQRVDVVKLGIVRSATATEQGRALQALKAQYQAIENTETGLAKALSKQTPAVREWALKKLQEVGNDPEQIQQIMQKLTGWSWTSMGLEAVNAMRLTGIPSWVVGAVTQTGAKALDIPIRTIAGIVDTVGDSILKKIYGENRQRWAGEAWADAQGMMDGISAGTRQAAKTLGSEAEAMKIAAKRGFQQSVAIKGRPGRDTMFDNFLDFIGPKIRLGFRPFAAVDNGLKPIFEQGSYRALVYRQVMSEGLQPGTDAFAKRTAQVLENPSFKLLDAADKDSEISMFREAAPQSVRYWNKLREAAPIVKFFDPFVTTAVNSFRVGARGIPGIGALTPHGVNAIQAGRGEAVDFAAKQMLGALTMWPFIKLAAQDKIKLEAPQNPWESYKFYASGRQPNSIEINGYSITFNRLSPFAEWPVTAKLVHDAIVNKDQKALSERVGTFIGAQGKNFVDKTFMKGISDVIEAVEDNKRYGSKFVRDTIAGALVPSILGYGARTADAVIRQPHTVLDAIKSRIPGMSEELLPKRGVFGEELSRPGGADAGGKAMRFLSPIQISKIKEDPLIQELDKQGLKVHYPPDTVNGRPLLPEEKDYISAQSGPKVKLAVQAQLSDPAFQALLPAQKQTALDTAVQEYRKPFQIKFEVPAELRALKIDPALVPKEAYPAIMGLLSDPGIKGADGKLVPSLYKVSTNDAWKKSVLILVIDSARRRKPY